MASAWATSNIDWTNIAEHRLDDVVYHLHKAVYERDYRVWYTGISNDSGDHPFYPGTSPSSNNYNVRTVTAWKEILNILKRWFCEDLSKFTYARNNQSKKYFMATRCFVSDDYVPDHYPNFKLNTYPSSHPYNNTKNVCYLSDHLAGIEVLDMAMGGELETLLGRDLQFLRDSDYIGQIKLEHLEAVYEILTTPMKCNVDAVIQRVSTGAFLLTAGDVQSSLIRIHPNSLSGSEPNVNDAVTEMYGLSESTYYSSSEFHFFRARKTGSSASAINRPLYHEFGFWLEIYFDGGFFTANDVKVSTFTFSDSADRNTDGGSTSNYGLMPTPAIFPEGMQRIENTFPSTSASGTPYGVIGRGQITSGVPTLSTDSGKEETLVEYSIRFLNIDLPGYLEYYTEPPTP